MAARSLGTLTLDLIANIGGYTQGLDKAEKEAQKRAKAIGDAFASATTSIKRGLAGAFTLVGIDLSIQGIVAFSKATLGAIDALNDVADATGASIENISALEDVARKTGTSIDTVSQTLVKFNQTIKEADPKKGVGASLEAIGLSVANLKSLDPAEAVRQIAVALSGFADDGTKGRLILELFGKSAKEVAPFLKDLAEQTKLVGSTSSAQAAEVEKFNKEIFKLQTSIGDLGRSFVKTLVPALNSTIELWQKNRKEGKSFYETIARGQLALLGNPFGLGKVTEGGASGDFSDPLQSLSSKLGRRPANEGGGGFNEQVLKDREEASKKAAQAAKQQAAEVASYVEGLQRQLLATKDLSVVEAALAEIQSGRLGRVNAAQKEAILGAAGQLDAAKKAKEAFEEQQRVLDEASDSQRALSEQGIAIFQATRTPLENLNAELRKLNDLQREGFIDWDTYKRAVEQAQDAFTELGNKGKKELSELDEFTKQAARNIQDALGDSIYDAVNGNFKNIGQSFTQLLLRMGSEAIAADIGNKLFGKDLKGGGLLSQLGDLFKPSGGTGGNNPSAYTAGGEGFFGTALKFFSGFFADGGTIPAGHFGVVGEKGMELVSGPATVTPMNKVGGTTLNVNVQASPGMSRDTALQQGAQIGAGIQRALARNA